MKLLYIFLSSLICGQFDVNRVVVAQNPAGGGTSFDPRFDSSVQKEDITDELDVNGSAGETSAATGSHAQNENEPHLKTNDSNRVVSPLEMNDSLKTNQSTIAYKGGNSIPLSKNDESPVPPNGNPIHIPLSNDGNSQNENPASPPNDSENSVTPSDNGNSVSTLNDNENSVTPSNGGNSVASNSNNGNSDSLGNDNSIAPGKGGNLLPLDNSVPLADNSKSNSSNEEDLDLNIDHTPTGTNGDNDNPTNSNESKPVDNNDGDDSDSSNGSQTGEEDQQAENVTVPSISDESTTNEPPVTHPASCNQDSINPTAPPDESEETIAALSIFFILVLLGISVVMVHLFIKFKFHYLPESIGFVAIGVVVGVIILVVKTTSGYDYQYQEKLSPQFFFLVLLPPIIFESGYSLHKGNFFQNLGSIIMFAVFGTAVSAVIVGGGIYGLGVMGVIYPLNLIESFTFGSLISAVDPVATLAIFHALDVDPTLNMLVFGESVLNDAVSIVLTKAILNQIPSETSSGSSSAASILGNSAWQFVVTFFGSAVLGVLSALFSAVFLKYINLRRHQSLEFAMWVIFAFGPYFLAEGMHLSGIMAVLFCGIVMSRYTHFNLSPVTQVTVQQALRTVAFMAETGVFLYLGLAMFSIHKSFDIALIIWSLMLILIGRAANIFPITAVMNQCRSVKISLRMQCIMWYSGLRGAVAFALAQNLQEYFSKEVTGYLVTTTLVIVLFTIVILGGSTLPLLKFLKADQGAKLTLSKTEEQDTTVSGQAVERSISRLNLKSFKGWSKAFIYFEFKYIRPIFMLTFTREEVKTARFEMQQKTTEWYQGLREASLSEEETTDMSTTTTGSTLLHSPI